jgi:hypothetical protein
LSAEPNTKINIVGTRKKLKARQAFAVYERPEDFGMYTKDKEKGN